MGDKPPFAVNIDFDEASRAWRQNKTCKGQCHFRYRCGHIKKNGEPCDGYPQILSKSKHAKYKDLKMQGWGPCRHHAHLYDDK
jgi:hypothetical protein